jgi:hypothetical protein
MTLSGRIALRCSLSLDEVKVKRLMLVAVLCEKQKRNYGYWFRYKVTFQRAANVKTRFQIKNNQVGNFTALLPSDLRLEAP